MDSEHETANSSEISEASSPTKDEVAMGCDVLKEPQTRDLNPHSAGAETEHKPVYEQSWAAVIGINNYIDRPLKFAVHDAAAMAKILINNYGFPPSNVFLVLDDVPNANDHLLTSWLDKIAPQLGRLEKKATKSVVEKIILTTLPEKTRPEDRVLVYFSGHGASRPTPGGDAKPQLAVADSVADAWETYVDLTNLLQGEQYLQAKHVFYIFDSCCSGLSGLRAMDAASHFEQSLLRRRARQCLTAGTAEEEVSDQGRNGHSIFTWHLLQALEGDLSDSDLLSASSLTELVKRGVGHEPGYKQAPSGFRIAGDKCGEFVFSASDLSLTLDERACLARDLIEVVDRRLDEPSVVELVLAIWSSVLSDKKTGPLASEALRRQGQALLMLGKTAEAQVLLDDHLLRDDPDAMLLRGVGRLRAGEIGLAKQELELLATQHGSHPYAGWARLMVEAAAQQPLGSTICFACRGRQICKTFFASPRLRQRRASARRGIQENAELRPSGIAV